MTLPPGTVWSDAAIRAATLWLATLFVGVSTALVATGETRPSLWASVD